MSVILAWRVTRDGKPYRTTDSAELAAFFVETHGFAAIPLVAAPPPTAVEEVRELLRELGGTYAGYETAGCGDIEIIDAEVNALESRILSYVAVAAPPPIGEDEVDLARRLSEAWAGKGEYADHDTDLLRGLCGEASVAIRALAPPVGTPTYVELAEALKDFLGSDEGGLLTRSHVRSHARALLARIPKEG